MGLFAWIILAVAVGIAVKFVLVRLGIVRPSPPRAGHEASRALGAAIRTSASTFAGSTMAGGGEYDASMEKDQLSYSADADNVVHLDYDPNQEEIARLLKNGHSKD